MYKVLVVEDDVLVRINIRTFAVWNSGEFEICGEATNGVDAQLIIGKLLPDIVLTDIQMPKMNGLELSKWINQNYPNIKLIVLSNFDDFEYVKGTFNNGAIDYILKHNLDSDTIENSLSMAKSLIVDQISNSNPKVDSLNQRLALRERFLHQILSGVFNTESEIIYQIKILDLNLDVQDVVPIVMSIDDYNTSIANGGLQDCLLIKFAIINVVEEIIEDFGKGAICHISNDRFALILSFSGIISQVVINNKIQSVIFRIRSCLQKFMNLNVSFSIGVKCKSITSILSSYKEAEINFTTNKFFNGKNCVFEKNLLNINSNIISGLSINHERSLLEDISREDSKYLEETLDRIFMEAKEMNISYSGIQILINDLMSIIHRECKKSGHEIVQLYNKAGLSYEKLMQSETFDDVKREVNKLFRMLHTNMQTSGMQINSPHITQTIKYMQENLSRDISLDSVAQEIGISTTYLSKKFKEEAGVGFSDYLCEQRLNKAKKMLLTNNISISEIAEKCGFNEYAYFFNVFKKKTGMTPKAFMRKNKY